MDAQEKINEIERILNTGGSKYGKLGVAISTRNRPALFSQCYDNYKKFLPEGAVLKVVDDASDIPVPEADYRFETNAGISRVKNMCLQLLYLEGCEWICLSDDDLWPIVHDWHIPYIESGEPHLMYEFVDFKNGTKLNDNAIIYKDSKKIAYKHCRGAFLIVHRSVLDRVGGFDTEFKTYAYEHSSWSIRIHNAGLTSFRFQDVHGSENMFYCDDYENNNANTTVKGQVRKELVEYNKKLYDQKMNDSHFIPFIEKENLFIATYFINVKDTQGRTWTNTLEPLMPLIKSVKNTRLIILHDCFEDSQINTLSQYNVTFVKVETSWNPYFQRWLSVREYLMKNRLWIENILMIDATDCVIQREPRWSEMAGIYTGDEPDLMEDSSGWLRKHHQHPKMIAFLDEYGKQYQLLNAGVFGAPVGTAIEFMRLMIDLYCELGNTQTTDMMCYQYILRMYFNGVLTYGREITTTFKKNETNNYSIIKHK